MMNEEYLPLDDFFKFTEHHGRLLQDNSTATGTNDSQVLRYTLKFYGSIFAVVFFLFCFLRRCYPKTFNIRIWVEDKYCDLAKDVVDFGFLGWAWKVRLMTGDEIQEQCGMDALCFLRMINFGFKICLVGIFNSIWLFPVYATSEASSETDYITDRVAQLSISFVPPGSRRFIATVIATYVVFGFTMYFILEEFKWFTAYRHKYLSERAPRNYSVYVAGIPKELRSNAMLKKFFQNCFSADAVLEAHVALNIPQLESKVSTRESLVQKLEHLINIEEVTGKTPMQRNLLNPTAPPVNAITANIEDLTVLNEKIEDDITKIEDMHNPSTRRIGQADADSLISQSQRADMSLADGCSVQSSLHDAMGMDSTVSFNGRGTGTSIVGSTTGESPVGSYLASEGDDRMGSTLMPLTETASMTEEGSESRYSEGPFGSVHKGVTGSLSNVARSTTNVAGSLHKNVSGGLSTLASNGFGLATIAIEMLMGGEGEPREGGFVSFKKLSTTQAALQMVHHATPFCMYITPAPDPEELNYGNVGKTNKQIQVGKLISFSLTCLLCLFWTLPVSFIASLTTIESLSQNVPFLADWIEQAPWLGNLLATLAPLLLIGLNALLPTILEIFTKLEFPLSDSLLGTGTFPKLAGFMIIQTFFVSAISGGILSALSAIAKNPAYAIDLLAISLPKQSTYFIQISLVRTFIGLSMELLRISPLAIAFLRSKIGPNLTAEESSRPFIGFLRPLNDPSEFQHANVAANNVFFFMVLFVYTAMAPLVNWFLGFCFILMDSAYRYQLACNYPQKPDSGGRMWLSFIGVVKVATIVAQLTLLGLLVLKESVAGVALMIPLLIVNLIFNYYIGQQHQRIADFLPSRECMKVDRKHFLAGQEDYSFLADEYKQPAMKEKEEVYPDNMSVSREVQHGNTKFATPPGSVADIEEQTGAQVNFSFKNSTVGDSQTIPAGVGNDGF